jgi:small subunit ribosomal protein S6
MRDYEIVVIVDESAEDGQVEGVVERITQILTQGGGEIVRVDRWGKRKLAYEINRKTEGIYVVVEFRADSEAVDELERVLSLADEVVRFKVVRKAA